MSLRLTVSVSQKVGQPNYGSLGASCQVECELASDMLRDGSERFQEAAQEVYAACAQAVADELARLQTPPVPLRLTQEMDSPPSAAEAATVVMTAVEKSSSTPRNGHLIRVRRRFASPAQVRAIRSLSQKLLVDLNQILWEGFQVERVEELTVPNASTLIQRLQAMFDRSLSS